MDTSVCLPIGRKVARPSAWEKWSIIASAEEPAGAAAFGKVSKFALGVGGQLSLFTGSYRQFGPMPVLRFGLRR